jgi:hypothetical protein
VTAAAERSGLQPTSIAWLPAVVVTARGAADTVRAASDSIVSIDGALGEGVGSAADARAIGRLMAANPTNNAHAQRARLDIVPRSTGPPVG